MNSGQLKSLFLFIALIGVAFNSHGQGVFSFGSDEDSVEMETNLLIEAQVLNGGSSFEGVTVEVRNGNTLMKSDLTKSNGFFSIKLNFDSLYTLSFVKDGYVTKHVEVDTRNIPDEDKEFGYDLGMFKIGMLKKEVGKDYENYSKAIARFRYNDVAQIFVVDKSYKKEVKQRFEESDEKLDIIKF